MAAIDSLARPLSWLTSGPGSGEHEEQQQQRNRDSKRKSRLPGGKPAIAAFCVSLVAFTIQTEAAQHVQQTLGYRKPFFSLYLGHSSFIFLFPLHLLCLRILKPRVPISHYLHLISQNIHWQVSTPTHTLPIPAADSIRRRISSLSMRSQRSSGDYDDDYTAADEFEVQEYGAQNRMRRRNLGPPPFTTWIEEKLGFNLWKLFGLLGVLTVGLTIPALSWYSAVPLTTMADITTIYNTYAVWALVFSIWFLGEKWELRKVFSVLLACGGVVLVAYGGAEHRRRPRESAEGPSPAAGDKDALLGVVEEAARVVKRQVEARVAAASGGNAFLGDLLAFFGAVTMAAYEMAFNIVGTLPNEEAQRTRYAKDSHSRNSRIVDSSTDEEPRRPHRADSEGGESQGLLEQQTGDEDADEHGVDGEIARKSMEVQHHNETAESTERTGLWNPKDSHEAGVTDSYQTISPAPEIEEEEDNVGLAGQEEGKKPAAGTVRILDVDGRLDRLNREMDDSTQDQPLAWIPPPLPFGMHPIIITSGIGFVTMCTLWIGLPIANLLGWEVFELPPDGKTWFFIIVVILTGIVFNGCFSILLAIWGPVLASVSCLLTTVLVFVADIMLGHDFQWISLLGCVSIAAGFGVLVQGGGMH